ncbi:MAG: nucleoside kinase [Oscillospiraceae bacterium]|nr:nucleoside kinase [Oscillospiraceae bacterium]
MKCITVEYLNKAAKKPEGFIAEGEKMYSEQLREAADKIFEHRADKPIVLISGPSGSGKTTSAMRVAADLKSRGCHSHVISMDNYFLPLKKDIELHGKDNIDYESPERLDIELFHEHLEKLSRGEEIEVPGFDFAQQDRIPGMKLLRGEGDLVILEGIHALNPLVTGDSDDYTHRIYVSVRTRIQEGEELLHPSKIRLMRRLMRDKLYRGRDQAETFEFFKSVERGEDLYIMPHKHRANFDIDTFIEYEPSVYRDILLPELEKTAQTYSGYSEFADIEKFLRLLTPTDKKYVPEDALIREFIG